MKNLLKKLVALLLISLTITTLIKAQKIPFEELTSDDIVTMSYDVLLSYPLEDVMLLAEKLGISIDDLLNQKSDIAAKMSLTTRESPAIITVITAEDIKNSGARDLIDILRLIPGIEFGIDVEAVTNLIIRGIWANEGKYSLQIDGLEINELLYSSNQLGNHFSPDQIKRIEIIRGPGSCMYGGFAELSVINIITKEQQDINKLSVTTSYGRMKDLMARQNVTLMTSQIFENGNFSLSAFAGQANRSNFDYTDMYETQYDMKDTGNFINSININTSFTYKNLTARFIYDDYFYTTVSHYDEILQPFDIRFRSILSQIKYKIQPNDKLTITPALFYTYQLPWYCSNQVYGYYYTKNIQRFAGEVLMNYNYSSNIELLGGINAFSDYAKELDKNPDNVFYNNTKEMDYQNISFFLQTVFKTKYVNLTIGGRYDIHSEVKHSFSPRLALTKIFGNFHYKLLFNKGFRAPGIENLNSAFFLSEDTIYSIAPKILPEKTFITELELGYKINSNMYFTLNLFNIDIKHCITYFYDSETEYDGYFNAERTGTYGLETEFKSKFLRGSFNLNYSFYTAKGKDIIPLFAVANNENVFLGAAQHKINLFGNYKFFKPNISIAPTATFLSKRFAYTSYNENNTPEDFDDDFYDLTEIEPVFLLNIFVNYNHFLTRNLTLGVGCYNIFNQLYYFCQPYDGSHAPFPAQGREIGVKLSYTVK